MAKYKDAVGGKIANREEVKENFQDAIKEAEEQAKKETQELRDRIMHYRELDFEQIRKEVTEKFEREYNPEERTIPKKEFLRELKEGKDLVGHATPYVEMKHDTEEEKEEIYQQYLADTKERCLRAELEYARSNDIVYDSMTEEQIEEVCSLYYAFTLKETLVHIKASTLAKAKLGSPERKVYKSWHDVLNNAYDEVQYEESTEVERIELLDHEKSKKKEEIKYSIGEAFQALGIGAFYGGLGGTIAYTVSGGTLPFGPSLGVGAGVLSAAFLTLFGVSTYQEFTKTKKAVEKAKELGVYDLMMDQARAARKLDDYERKLNEQSNVEEIIEEEFPRVVRGGK